MSKPVRVLIVDDHEMVRVGLRALLSREPEIEVAGEAGNRLDAVARTNELTPDVVLLDLRLGEESGFDVCRDLQKSGSEAHVLALTSYADDGMVLEAISAGADGYLLKEIDRESLVDAIKKVAAGHSILDPKVTGRLFSRVQALMEEPSSKTGKLGLLSPQEKKVLALVAQGKTNKEIGAAMGLSDKTVKNYFSNILDKLNLSRRSQAAAYFIQHSN